VLIGSLTRRFSAVAVVAARRIRISVVVLILHLGVLVVQVDLPYSP
jgi:hypothetical protein